MKHRARGTMSSARVAYVPVVPAAAALVKAALVTVTLMTVTLVAVVTFSLLLTGCGSGEDSGSETTQSATPTQKVGLYPVTTSTGEMGFIDKTGGLVISAQFAEAAAFSDGLAAVRMDAGGLWGYIDAAGQMVIDAQFAEASPFSEGLAAVRIDVNGSWGFADKTGALVIPPQFASAHDFSEGLARVRSGQESGYIDQTGEWVIRMSTHEAVGEFSGGLALIFDRTADLYGYVDPDGNVVVEPTYSDAWGFSEDLAVARLPGSDSYGYIDRHGEWVIGPQFADARPFSEGVAAVLFTSTQTWGYVDATGSELVPGRWDAAEQFNGGVARVGLLVGGADGAGSLLWGYAYVGLDGVLIWEDQAYAAFTAPGATTTTFAPDPPLPADLATTTTAP